MLNERIEAQFEALDSTESFLERYSIKVEDKLMEISILCFSI